MAANVTMTLYLGSLPEGEKNNELVRDEAKKRGMSKSEFALYCMYETIKRESGKELTLKP